MSTAPSFKPAPSAHILIVDDNKMGLSARSNVLEELGYRISPYSTPMDALKDFSQHTYDLVITDFKMPSMNGIEFIGHLRQSRPTIPIILISGFADTLGLNEQSTGADVVIQKSNHEVTNLIRSVQRLLNKKKPSTRQGSSRKPIRKIV